MNVRKPGAGHIESHRFTANGQQKGAERMPSAIRRFDMCIVDVNRSDACAKAQVDFVLFIKLCRPQ